MATGALAINGSGQTLINEGILEASLGGTLTLNGTINNSSSGGLIEANGSSNEDPTVVLNNVTLIGGTLSGNGDFVGTGLTNNTLDGLTSAVTNASNVALDFATLALEGTINNTGTIALIGGSTVLAINAAGATLKGGGTITLDDAINIETEEPFLVSISSNAASAKLINVNNIISGDGNIGNSGSNTMTLVNLSKGVIDANEGAGAYPLVIDTGTNAIVNSGTLEATGTGNELYIASSVTNSLGNLTANQGEVVAAGAVAGGGAIIEGAGTVEFGAASTANTRFAVASTGKLILDDAVQYTGTVVGFGANTTQSINLPNVQFATLSKSYLPASPNTSGTLTVKDTAGDIAHIKFNGTYTLSKFTFADDGNGGTLITDPPVERWAHGVSGNWTTVSNWSPSVVPGYNDNVVINSGPYTVTSLADETVNNFVLGAGVSLGVEGGSGFVALTGATNSGTIEVQDNSTFEIGGTLSNAGVILLNSTGDTTEWVIDGNVTLGGGGKVHLTNTAIVRYGLTAAAIVSDGSIGALTNVNNTLYGNGTIGDANLTVVNQSLGVIEAGAGQSLTITGALTNSGNVESYGYGSLQFDSDDVNNSGGKIRALAIGASISLDGATITGGTISTVAGSTMTGSGGSELDGTTISNAGDLAAASGNTFTINSSVINNGTLQAYGNLILNGVVTGTGSATIVGTGELQVESAFAENISFAAGSTGTLILDTPAALSGTIHGFGDGTIDLPNIGFGIGTTFSYAPNASNTGGTLHVSDGNHSANIGLFGHFQAAGFQDGDDGAGGTLIGYVAPIFWKSGVSGNFATASNWNPADIPGSGNGAIITAAGTYTVVSSLNETVYSLTTAIGATLEIAAPTFTVTNQAGAVTNAGTIAVDSTGILAIDQGLIKNTGTIAISGDLNFGGFSPPTNVTLRGGGSVILGGISASLNSFNLTTTLTNADNTISGVGNVSLSNTLINQSSGIIDAGGSGLQDANNNLQIDSPNLNNLGTIENTGYGFLLVFGNQGYNTITNSGVIKGNDWSISGNLINSNMIEATGSNATDSITGPVDNTGNIEVLGATNGLSINGAITETGNETINNGTLSLFAAVSAGQQLTFSGSSGALVLDDAPDFAGTVAGFALDNSIDLTTIKFYSSSFHLTYTPNENNTGGVLSVTDGTNSAAINLVGSYTPANFVPKTDGSVGTLITDPPVIEQPSGGAAATIANDTVLEVNTADSSNVTFVGATGALWLDQPATFTGTVAGFRAQDRIDLSSIGFGAHTTLGYSENNSDTGGTLTVTDGTHAAAIALFGNYMASTLVAGADGHGGTLVTEGPLPNQPPPLAHPHA